MSSEILNDWKDQNTKEKTTKQVGILLLQVIKQRNYME